MLWKKDKVKMENQSWSFCETDIKQHVSRGRDNYPTIILTADNVCWEDNEGKIQSHPGVPAAYVRISEFYQLKVSLTWHQNVVKRFT